MLMNNFVYTSFDKTTYKQVIAQSMQSYKDNGQLNCTQWRKLNAYDNAAPCHWQKPMVYNSDALNMGNSSSHILSLTVSVRSNLMQWLGFFYQHSISFLMGCQMTDLLPSTEQPTSFKPPGLKFQYIPVKYQTCIRLHQFLKPSPGCVEFHSLRMAISNNFIIQSEVHNL